MTINKSHASGLQPDACWGQQEYFFPLMNNWPAIFWCVWWLGVLCFFFFLPSSELSWRATVGDGIPDSVDQCSEVIYRILFLRWLAGLSWPHAQGIADCQICGQEEIFLQVRLAGTLDIFAFLCSMEHRSPARNTWASLSYQFPAIPGISGIGGISIFPVFCLCTQQFSVWGLQCFSLSKFTGLNKGFVGEI